MKTVVSRQMTVRTGTGLGTGQDKTLSVNVSVNQANAADVHAEHVYRYHRDHPDARKAGSDSLALALLP